MCSRIAELRCLTTKKERSLDLCPRILSRLRRLPPEILGEIFLACKDEALGEPHTILRKQPPSVLSQVCRSWRQVAINLPRLWDTFRVNYATTFYPPEGGNHVLPLSRMIDIWAFRSKPLPINVAIHSNYQLSGSRPIPASLVTSLRDLSHRIRKLDIQTDLKSIFEPIFSLPAAEFPALESLQLSVIEFGVWNRTITAFGGSPNLRKVTLNIHPPHPFRIFLPWSQITHLDMLNVIDLFTWNMLIHSLLNLVQGRVRLGEEGGVQDPFRDSLSSIERPTELTLPALNLLTINLIHREGLNNVPPFIPPNLRVPALTHFHLSSGPRPLSWYPTLQEMLVPRILGQLKSLTFLNVRMGTDQLIDVLRKTTSLEDLKFNSRGSNWDLRDNISFLDTLSITGPSTNPEERGSALVAPRLRKIGLWVEDMCSELLQSYISLIQARRREDPENTVFQGTDDFRVLLMLDKNRPDVMQAIAPLLVLSGWRGQKLVDVELVEVA